VAVGGHCSSTKGILCKAHMYKLCSIPCGMQHNSYALFIDDLCVDKQARGQHIGESLFEYVKQQAKKLGCYEVTLNVWAGNTSTESFYEKMGMKTKERQMEYIL